MLACCKRKLKNARHDQKISAKQKYFYFLGKKPSPMFVNAQTSSAQNGILWSDAWN